MFWEVLQEIIKTLDVEIDDDNNTSIHTFRLDIILIVPKWFKAMLYNTGYMHMFRTPSSHPPSTYLCVKFLMFIEDGIGLKVVA